MKVELNENIVLEQLGNPAKVAKELESFQRAAKVLSSKQPRMIDEYPKQWIAVHQGKVKASGKTFKSLMTAIEKRRLPRQNLIIRFIDKSERTMIL